MKKKYWLSTFFIMSMISAISIMAVVPFNRLTAPLKKGELLITGVGDDEIHIYSLLDDGNTLLLKLTKKEWGTLNIDGWYIALDGAVPSRKQKLMVGGGSDWEYVFRVAKAPDTQYVFSGGNHGNERLNSLRFIGAKADVGMNDGTGIKNSAEINLSAGGEYIADSLTIIENTSLTYDENIMNRYADVRRVYSISPSKITLNNTIAFNSDIYMGTSYVSMLPATKEYGRYALFDGTGDLSVTPGPGETKTTGAFENYLGMKDTLSATVWGDSNPGYRFRAWISDRSMVDNFSNKLKVFYWDVNKYGNKLYFSRFDNEGHTKISAGTVWNNRQGWELISQ